MYGFLTPCKEDDDEDEDEVEGENQGEMQGEDQNEGKCSVGDDYLGANVPAREVILDGLNESLDGICFHRDSVGRFEGGGGCSGSGGDGHEEKSERGSSVQGALMAGGGEWTRIHHGRRRVNEDTSWQEESERGYIMAGGE